MKMMKKEGNLWKKSRFNKKFSDDSDNDNHGEKKLSSLERRKLYSENLGQRKKSYARPTSARARKDDSDDDDDSYRKKSLRRPGSVNRDFYDEDDDMKRGRRGSRGSSKDNDEAEVS